LGNLICYPNPASNKLTILHAKSTSIIIQNSLGEIIYTNENLNSFETIDVSGFANGLYVLRCNNEQTKFIKQ